MLNSMKRQQMLKVSYVALLALVITTVFDTKATEIDNKIFYITGLATFVDLNTEIRRKIPDTTTLVLLLLL